MSQQSPLEVNLFQENALLQILPNPSGLSSYGMDWHGVGLEQVQLPAGWETPEHTPQQHVIVVHLIQEMGLERQLGDRRQQENIVPGDVMLLPANVNHSTTSRQPGDALLLTLAPETLSHNLQELVDPSQLELIPHFAQPDPLIYQVGRAIKNELETYGSYSRLFAESAALMLSVHLLRQYSTQSPNIQYYSDGLSRRELSQVIDYINNYLDQDLSLTTLANLVGMSPPYFSSLFKRVTGLTPHQYVIRCRVERARQLLLTTRLSVTEIARRVGFAHQSHLSRHFKRHFGVTPKVMRSQS